MSATIPTLLKKTEQELSLLTRAQILPIAVLQTLPKKGDVIITQDYGLATLVLGKGAKALNQNGLIYTDGNIENLLFTRFIGKKERMAGNRTKGPKKRTDQNDADFLKALLLCVG